VRGEDVVAVEGVGAVVDSGVEGRVVVDDNTASVVVVEEELSVLAFGGVDSGGAGDGIVENCSFNASGSVFRGGAV